MATINRILFVLLLLIVLPSCGNLASTYNQQSEAAKENNEALSINVALACTTDKLVLGNTTLYELDKASGKVLTKLPLHSKLSASPLIIDGTTYICTDDSKARAVRDGKEVWITQLSDKIANTSTTSIKVRSSGDYLCISGPEMVACVSRASGKLLWQKDMMGECHISDKMLYGEDPSHKAVAVNLADGKTAWTEDIKETEQNTGTQLLKDNFLYVAHYHGFAKLDAGTGKTLWRKEKLPFEFINPVLVALPGDHIGAADRNWRLAVFDCSSGNYYTYAGADDQPFPTDLDSLAQSSDADRFLVQDKTVYAGGRSSFGSFMSCFDPSTKKRNWTTTIQEKTMSVDIANIQADPILVNNALVFPLDTGTVYALDSATGKILWKTRTGRHCGYVEHPLFLSNDTACIYGDTGVSALNAHDGTKLWSLNPEQQKLTRTAIQDGGRLYIATKEGTAYAIDVNEGKVAWSFAVDGTRAKTDAAVVREGTKVQKEFSPEAWKNAKKQPNWSRHKLMAAFFKENMEKIENLEMTRDEVVALLGEPEVRSDSYKNDTDGKSSEPASTSDYYQLDEKTQLTFTYNDKRIATFCARSEKPLLFKDYFVESGPAKITMEQAKDAMTKSNLAEVQKLLGEPDKSELNIPPDFATPFRSSLYLWRLASDGRKSLRIATSGLFHEDLQKRRLDGGSITTLSPDFQ